MVSSDVINVLTMVASTKAIRTMHGGVYIGDQFHAGYC